MKIAVCIKQVPRRDWHPRVNAEGTWVRSEEPSYEMNEPDGFALEEAFRLREQQGGEVIVCSAGPARVDTLLREGLARGADQAIHVSSDGLTAADPAVVAAALAGALADEHCDLVLTGLQSDDMGSAATGVMLAAELGLVHATIVAKLEVADGSVVVTRELESGWFQRITLGLPALLTVQSGVHPLRYATLKGIMAAKNKPIRAVTPTLREATIEIVAVEPPSRTRRAEMLTGDPAASARAVVRRLEQEGLL